MTTKQKRKYSQDFSGPSLTDRSHAAAADINNIVADYARKGIEIGGPLDPRAKYIQTGDQGEVPPLGYSDAMRAKAEIQSSFQELPEAERLEHGNAAAWFEALQTPEPIPEPTPEPIPDPIPDPIPEPEPPAT